jgi:hypothetical protein
MIVIEKNSYNLIALTLSEKSTVVNPYYLFVFNNEANGMEKIFTCPHITSNQRYQSFEILETPAENLLNGSIYLTGNSAQLTYKIYESEFPFSANTLSISATTGVILEKGRVQLNGIDNNINEIYL